MPLPLTPADLSAAWERVRENEGCAGAAGFWAGAGSGTIGG